MSERKPLTLEKLWKMELKPVWLITYSVKNKIPRISQWALVASASNYSVSFVRVAVSGRMEKKCGDYGKTWLAYATAPPRLDRSAWEPCDFCGKELDDYPYIVAHSDYDESNTCYTPAFCPVCSRPLTDAAWEMLEKRLENAK